MDVHRGWPVYEIPAQRLAAQRVNLRVAVAIDTQGIPARGARCLALR
jgi:hypothetical protein